MSLFLPYSKGNLTLKNRLVMPPMTTCHVDPNGNPNQELADYYINRAKSGIGLIVIEAASIDDSSSKAYVNGLQYFSKAHCEAWKPIVERIHEYGSKVFLQLFHAGRLTTSEVCGEQPISASPVAPNKQRSNFMIKKDNDYVHYQSLTPFSVPREMNIQDINCVQEKFENSCKLSAIAGFDGVELHCAHGYLLHQFCHGQINRRLDAYGHDSKLRFLRETVIKCHQALPNNRVLAVRLSQHMVDNSYLRYSEKNLNFEHVVASIDDYVDVYHCSTIEVDNPIFGFNKSLMEVVRQKTDKTIVACGRVDSKEKAERILHSGVADLIAIGRPLIANQNLVKLFLNGREDEMIPFNNNLHLKDLK